MCVCLLLCVTSLCRLSLLIRVMFISPPPRTFPFQEPIQEGPQSQSCELCMLPCLVPIICLCITMLLYVYGVAKRFISCCGFCIKPHCIDVMGCYVHEVPLWAEEEHITRPAHSIITYVHICICLAPSLVCSYSHGICNYSNTTIYKS